MPAHYPASRVSHGPDFGSLWRAGNHSFELSLLHTILAFSLASCRRLLRCSNLNQEGSYAYARWIELSVANHCRNPSPRLMFARGGSMSPEGARGVRAINGCSWALWAQRSTRCRCVQLVDGKPTAREIREREGETVYQWKRQEREKLHQPFHVSKDALR